MKRVLITGAAGRIGTLLRERLAGRYELHSLTHRLADFPSHVASVADLDAIRPAFEGMDAVVHLAVAKQGWNAWQVALDDNIRGTHNVCEAARLAGVGSVVFTSTNHVVSGYEIETGPSLYELGDPRVIDEHADVRPDSVYGFSKAAGEATCRYYSDVHGLRAYVLRIGWVIPDDDYRKVNFALEAAPPLDLAGKRARLRALYLSHHDCAELVAACLEAEHVRFGIYYGTSNHPRQFQSLANAARDLGWRPRDSAPVDLAELPGVE
jgi:nucleoside-diphosphate-sugar epimerase